MKDRTLGIILGGLDILLMAVCIIFYLGLDKTAPEITLGEVNYVYEEDFPESFLLEAVSAWDEKDGDLTEKVVVEKVVTDKLWKKAVITYGVADSSGNVSRASRILEMPVAEKPQLPTAGEAGNMGTGPEPGTAGQNPETVEADTVVGAENTRETEEATVQNAGSETGDGKPVIVFTSRELTVKTGEQPDWTSVMGEVQDDKDAKETLLGTLEIKGEYDLEKAGEYYLTLSITDSDGNVSNAYPMKLLVKE